MRPRRKGKVCGKLTGQEEVIYEVAFNLGIPVYEIENKMPYTELLKWISFFNSRPVGWREDQRTFLILKSFGFKGKAEDLFASLKQIKTNQIDNQKPDKALRKGKFLEKMLSAVNGDDSGWKPNWENKNVNKDKS